MSRPISRLSYFSSHVLVALCGLVLLVAALLAGNLVGTHYNPIDEPPGLRILLRPSLNLLAFGMAIYGYTLLFSSVDVVRWRPNLIGSVLTLGGFIAYVVANAPSLEDWKWLEKLSIFKAYNPVEAAVSGENLAFNAGILAAVGGAGIVLGFLAFNRRDLPAGGG